MLTSKELRQKYLDFFASKGHTIIPSASLIPENDPTVLFTTAGMHPLVPYLLGEKHPGGNRVTNAQKCIRTGDIDEVGDKSHLTFFEMLGNWSFGSYFKQEAIEWSWEFLTGKEWLGLDPKKLAVTVFLGDENCPFDQEAYDAWLKLGVPAERIGKLPKKNNWWGPAGQTGPCGPDTEMFFWRGNDGYPPAGSNPETDEDDWLEIWNDVFMQYFKNAEGKYEPLKQQNVDTGMGLERTVTVLSGRTDVYEADTLWPLILKIQEISHHQYNESEEIKRSMRIIVDHLRAVTMIIGDDHGTVPSNVDQGYVVRRLIRRAIRHGRLLGIQTNFCAHIAEEVVKIFADVYSEVVRNKDFVLAEIEREETKFRDTLESGIRMFEGERGKGKEESVISKKEAFDLYQSYGFPLEMTIELATEKGLAVDVAGFEEEMKKHQDLSRAGAEQKFKGGLADTSEISTKYHTATHLLHAALRKVLGEHVAQKGSNITAERLRFDFSHPDKMTEEQKKAVEDLVNSAIQADYPVTFAEMTVPEAKAKGAIGLFEDKYGSMVKVYSVGDPEQVPSATAESLTFSKEICGGPHVERTGTMGVFKISKEEAVSAGVRRIKAVLS